MLEELDELQRQEDEERALKTTKATLAKHRGPNDFAYAFQQQGRSRYQRW